MRPPSTLGRVTDPSVPIIPGAAPSQAPPPVVSPPPPQTKTMASQVALGVFIAFGGVAVILLVVALVAGAFNRDGGSTPTAARDDVKVTSCGTTAAGNLSALVTVTNSTERERDYFITVAFLQGNTQLGTGSAFVRDLQPGQKAEDEAIAFVRSAPSGIRCSVTEVSRV